ncbi:MAG: hypothetical protein K0V04_09595 [Deltaproteobacteria bacterium]|nr:hypothetical protein [Deltaproteobacteria bacterium]
MLALLIVSTLAAPVWIDGRELDAVYDSTALRGQVLERVLEAGHTLGPDATIRIELHGDETELQIVLRVGEQSWEDRVPTAARPPSVVGLEVAQRVVALLAAHAPMEDGAAGAAGDDTVRIDAAVEDDGLRRDLLRVLVDDGRAVVPSDREDARWVVCGRRDPEGDRIVIGEGSAGCAEGLATASAYDDPSEAVAQAWLSARWPATESAVGATDPISAPPEDEVVESVPPADDPPVASPLPEPSAPDRALALELGVDAGVSIRPPLTGRFGVMAMIGRGTGPQGLLELGVLPSRGNESLWVIDTTVAAGFGWRWSLGQRWRLVPAAVVGLRVHTPRFAGARPESAVDLTVSLPVRLQWRALPRLGVGLRVAPGFDGRARVHRVNGSEVWARGPWRLDIGVTLSVILGGRSSR